MAIFPSFNSTANQSPSQQQAGDSRNEEQRRSPRGPRPTPAPRNAHGGGKPQYVQSYQRNNNNNYSKNLRFSSQYPDTDDSCSSTDSDFSSNSDCSMQSASSSSSNASFMHSYKKPVMPARNMYLAMDCEMVGVEVPASDEDYIFGGGAETTTKSVCARVVLIDWKGRTVLDSYVKPDLPVSDYRTFVSGITAEHLVNAPSMATVQAQVLELLNGKILVGHGLENDLACLEIEHPWWMIRDTAYYEPFMQERVVKTESMMVPRKLRDLCKTKLHRDIQTPGQSHCPAEDAQAALDLYKSHRPRWEACLQKQQQQLQREMRQQRRAEQRYYQQQQQQRAAYHQQQQMAAYDAVPMAFVSY